MVSGKRSAGNREAKLAGVLDLVNRRMPERRVWRQRLVDLQEVRFERCGGVAQGHRGFIAGAFKGATRYRLRVEHDSCLRKSGSLRNSESSG